jgi:hypothetical protein
MEINKNMKNKIITNQLIITTGDKGRHKQYTRRLETQNK